jgi:UDP-N-acetylglucosamine 2-epimerase (non-hydrolysing)
VVVVPGDVNSTLAAALAAVKLEIDVAHIESGLRSFDRSMPEEINRVLVDQVARWCFIHSGEAAENLRREGVPPEHVFFVGNTMIDTLLRMRPLVERSDAIERLGLTQGEYVLVTLHRPALVDGELFPAVLEGLRRLSKVLPVVYPMHPRSRARLDGAIAGDERLHLVDPVGYLDFLALQMGSAAVITDSGGVQEETTWLRIPCFTLRENTERPVTLHQGTNRLLGLDPVAVARLPELLGGSVVPLAPPPGWDGHAGERLADVLCEALDTGDVSDDSGTARADRSL